MIFGLHRRLPLHTATSISVAVPAHQHRARLKYHTPHAMVLRCQVGYDGDPRKSRGVPAAESLKRPTSRSFHPRLSAAGSCSPLALSKLSALPSYVDRTFKCARETLKHYKALLSWSTSSGPGRQRSGQGGRVTSVRLNASALQEPLFQ